MASLSLNKNNATNFKIDPLQFTLLLFLVSVAMMFAAFTSGYIVRKGQGNWVEYALPSVFLYSCISVVGASMTMVLAQWAQKKGNKVLMQLGLFASLAVGLAFVYYQFSGWQTLMDQGIYLVGNPSGSFLFVISGVHLVHFAVGILVIFIALIRSFILGGDEFKTQRITSAATYWHFVGALWIYLYLFLSNA